MYSERLAAAFEWASRLHAAQTRKGVETPYLSHLLGVASLILEYGGTEDEVIAGLLHDAVEDCGGLPMLADIRAKFGSVVADIVSACSDSVTSDPEAKSDWEVRKRAYVAAVAAKSNAACFVTACDKLHNATAIFEDDLLGSAPDGTTVWHRFGGKSKEQTIAYYSAMAEALRGRVPAALWQRFARTVAALEALAKPAEHQRWLGVLRTPPHLAA